MIARSVRAVLRTLRGRLLLVLLTTTVVGLFVMGSTSVGLLHRSLIDRVDDRLMEISGPWQEGGSPRPSQPPPGREPPDLPTDFRLIFFDATGDFSAMVGQTASDASGPMLPRALALSAPGTVPDRVGGSGWRVRTVSTPDGGTIALALSLSTVDSTVRELVAIELVVGAGVLIVLATAAAVTVGLGLRPLTRIEHTAHAIATGELNRRIPDQDPRTETGRLGAALNTMLGRLVAALQQREQSEQRLRRFVADASHELRTPLTSIRGFAELYRRSHEPNAAEVQAMMSRIENQAARMGSLVDDLLLLARLDRERTVDLTYLNLVSLVDDIVRDGRVRAPERDITFHAPDYAVRVLGDAHRLRQVLDNLLSNAMVHTKPGSPVSVVVGHGAVSGHVTAAAGAEVATGTPMGTVAITDAGPGIPLAHAQRIFDRFYRVDEGRARHTAGTGLGLAISAAIAEAHNGRLELATEPATGSTFRLLIPLACPNSEFPVEAALSRSR